MMERQRQSVGHTQANQKGKYKFYNLQCTYIVLDGSLEQLIYIIVYHVV